MTDNLHDRIRAALDQEEALALAATPGPWVSYGDRSAPYYGEDDPPPPDYWRVAVDDERAHLDAEYAADAEYVAAQDPARTLRRIEADRRVLARHVALDKMWCTYCGPMWIWPCGDVRDLAARYDVTPEGGTE